MVHPRQDRIRNGFTLIEVLAAAAILAFVSAVITHTVTAGQVQTHDSLHQARGLFLAEALMEEILRLPYADPSDGSTTLGPETGETTRASFDNADDYHGFPHNSSIEAPGAVADLHGVLYPTAYQGFTRTVTCQYVTQNVPDLGGTIEGLLVTVTVRDATQRAWTLTRFIMDTSENGG
jgi:prepilin-type N-terminal cleavage/methylation domain-containing protein